MLIHLVGRLDTIVSVETTLIHGNFLIKIYLCVYLPECKLDCFLHPFHSCHVYSLDKEQHIRRDYLYSFQ